MAEMSVPDIQRDICGTLVQYEGVPVVAKEISRDGKNLTVRRVMDNHEFKVPFSLQSVTAIRGRIGMINGATGSVYYMERIPVRRMSIGINSNNSRASIVFDGDGDEYSNIKEFSHHGLDDAINNRYPTFRQAIKFAKNCNGACAFDKQFAVDHKGAIYYKDKGRVGKIVAPFKTIDKIEWNAGKEHLFFLLENDYEKTVRTFRG